MKENLNNSQIETKFSCSYCSRKIIVKDHPNRPRKFCSRQCNAKAQKRDHKYAVCHPDRRHRSLGLCKQCWSFQDTMKREYGITPEQWESMFKKQGGLCAICLKSIHRPYDGSGKRAADVDHDHKTGEVRGLLCHVCNRHCVGHNTVESAKRVLEYLMNGLPHAK